MSDLELLVRLNHRDGFKIGSSRLSPEVLRTLRLIAPVLLRYRNTALIIEGHADSLSGDLFNQSLSQRRAIAVRDDLVRQHIFPGRISVKGLGERMALCPNTSQQGRACNRRVEIRIISIL